MLRSPTADSNMSFPIMRLRIRVESLLLLFAANVAAHQHDENHKANATGTQTSTESPSSTKHDDLYDIASYSGISKHSDIILAHIVVMVLAWVFILPVGIVFSIGKSRLTMMVQSLFLIFNGLGVMFGTIYNLKTPDLYENNAHHTIGWIATWIMTMQVIFGLLSIYVRQSKKGNLSAIDPDSLLPLPLANTTQRGRNPYSDPLLLDHWDHSSETLSCEDNLTTHTIDAHQLGEDTRRHKPESTHEYPSNSIPRVRQLLRNRLAGRFLPAHLPRILPPRLLKTLGVIAAVVDRTILLLGFIALVTGGITYTGIFRGRHLFNGLAHFIKGGIFFWYGLLTLGRWMGCFADLGWAWNAKPSPSRPKAGQFKAAMPSAEFTESFVIFLYGLSNVFLEHLAAWGAAWTAQDLEHVSISIMFFGGGLCGMLVESKTIRKWLNTAVENLPPHDDKTDTTRSPPKTYNLSMNPIPALIILLLGIMMSSHHQSSMISTMVHKQWGMLLAGFSVMRMLTYLFMSVSPPSSLYPSRPPSELVSSFCLISGGIVFMASTKDIVHWMEVEDVGPMVVFTVAMGLTAFIMAWEIVVLALKGWAVRREMKKGSSRVTRSRS